MESRESQKTDKQISIYFRKSDEEKFSFKKKLYIAHAILFGAFHNSKPSLDDSTLHTQLYSLNHDRASGIIIDNVIENQKEPYEICVEFIVSFTKKNINYFVRKAVYIYPSSSKEDANVKVEEREDYNSKFFIRGIGEYFAKIGEPIKFSASELIRVGKDAVRTNHHTFWNKQGQLDEREEPTNSASYIDSLPPEMPESHVDIEQLMPKNANQLHIPRLVYTEGSWIVNQAISAARYLQDAEKDKDVNAAYQRALEALQRGKIDSDDFALMHTYKAPNPDKPGEFYPSIKEEATTFYRSPTTGEPSRAKTLYHESMENYYDSLDKNWRERADAQEKQQSVQKTSAEKEEPFTKRPSGRK